MTLDEHLAEILDFSAPGYQRMTITPYGIRRHSAMSSMVAVHVEKLDEEHAQKFYGELAARANRFGRVNSAFIAELPVNHFAVFSETIRIGMDGGGLSLRLMMIGEHHEDDFHVHVIALLPEEIDAAMRYVLGEKYAEADDLHGQGPWVSHSLPPATRAQPGRIM